VKASPLARRVAHDLGVGLEALQGSGPGGRIVRADVERAHAQPAAATAPAAAAPAASAPEPAGEAAPTGRGDVTVEELSRTQQVIARRMSESRATVPEFTLSTLVDMDASVRLRAELKQAALDPTPSYNDLVIKACALALREHPRANGSYKDGRFELYGRVNVGMAVAAQDALVVPTVFDADRRSLGDIARTTRALAARVRDGLVTPPELSGGTFSVSNLGMFGVTEFQAVINAPQAAILAVGALRQEPVVRDGQVVPGHVMAITLSCDHRILYGADAARFLARVRELLERPLALLAG
jgi:pyruvate dehydrogenase E2 component (dihydrolipoamide acetyltransferase)